MKNLKKVSYIIVYAMAISFAFQCASPKLTTPNLEQQTPFTVKPVTFQEWYAGIKVGGTGINIFLPISNSDEGVSFNEVFFRNLRGNLIKEEGQYTSVLKHPSRLYTFKKADRPMDYPFKLKDDECVISYTENGQLKYYKIKAINEVAGTYYENGPPSIYAQSSANGMASLDEEDDEN